MTTRLTINSSAPRVSTAAGSNKSRQMALLHSKLDSLSANLADLENLLRMTSIQADSIKGLGAWHCGLFMAASKVLGEETITGSAAAANTKNHGVPPREKE